MSNTHVHGQTAQSQSQGSSGIDPIPADQPNDDRVEKFKDAALRPYIP